MLTQLRTSDLTSTKILFFFFVDVFMFTQLRTSDLRRVYASFKSSNKWTDTECKKSSRVATNFDSTRASDLRRVNAILQTRLAQESQSDPCVVGSRLSRSDPALALLPSGSSIFSPHDGDHSNEKVERSGIDHESVEREGVERRGMERGPRRPLQRTPPAFLPDS